MPRSNSHGMTKTRTYKSWTSMKERCSNPNKDTYARYGGRGITVCERWMKFENFLEDMGKRPENTTLDRIDYDGNYEPDNCRWACPIKQANNTSFNRRLTVDGETLTVSEWAVRVGMSRHTIFRRLEYGWSDERAVKTPRRDYPKHIKQPDRRVAK